MNKKTSYTRYQLLAVGIILFGVYLYTQPSSNVQAPGYAAISDNESLTNRIASIRIDDFTDPSTPADVKLEKKWKSEEQREMQDKVVDPKPKEETIQNTRETAKVSSPAKADPKPEDTKEEIVVKEEVIVLPDAGEERIVSVNTQYIGNSGMVFDTFEEADAYGKQQLIDYPDTTGGYHVLNSWKYPVNGSTLFTVDLDFIS